jgi:hypothetical protein
VAPALTMLHVMLMDSARVSQTVRGRSVGLTAVAGCAGFVQTTSCVVQLVNVSA